MSLIDREKLLEEVKVWLNNHKADDRNIFDVINNAPVVNEEAWLIENEKKILAMEVEIATLKQDRNDLNYLCMERLHKIDELQASNNRLREALETCSYDDAQENGLIEPHFYFDYEKVNAAISATPAESLALHDNEVIEKCAQVCFSDGSQLAWNLAEKILALKEVK